VYFSLNITEKRLENELFGVKGTFRYC